LLETPLLDTIVYRWDYRRGKIPGRDFVQRAEL